ncbi:MAG: hypothetical protein AAF570_04230 [Bacteroidota bacterium]
MKKYLILMVAMIGLGQFVNAMPPMHISFEELCERAPRVVVAKFKGGHDAAEKIAVNFDLFVIKTLKGPELVGKTTVQRLEGTPDLEVGALCVAFLTEDNEFGWVAEPRDKVNPFKGIWDLRGFYDFNAYLVSPSVMSFSQIKEGIHGRMKGYNLEGALAFFDPASNSVQPSEHRFQFSVDPGSEGGWKMETKVPMNDLVEIEQAGMSAGFGADFSVRLTSNVDVRSLEIYGNVVAFDPETEVFSMQFWMPNPSIYRKQDLLPFLKDPAIAFPWYELELVLEDGRKWTFELNKEYGRIGTVEKEDGVRYGLGMMQDNPLLLQISGSGGKEYWVRGDDLKAMGLEYTGSDGALFQRLMLSGMPCEVWGDRAGEKFDETKGTMRLRAVHFRKF